MKNSKSSVDVTFGNKFVGQNMFFGFDKSWVKEFGSKQSFDIFSFDLCFCDRSFFGKLELFTFRGSTAKGSQKQEQQQLGHNNM